MGLRWFIVGAATVTTSCGFSTIGSGGPASIASAGNGSSSSDAAGSAIGDGTPEGSTTSGGADSTDGDAEGIGSLTTPTSEDDADDVEDAGEESVGEESSGDDAAAVCANLPFFKQIVLAADAIVAGPMMQWPSPEGVFAASPIADEGTATFLWEAPCADEYRLWARVWDLVPGPFDDGPDSFYVSLGDGAEIPWYYGCQTATTLVPAWHWARLEQTYTCFDEAVPSFDVAAGLHAFVFRGREGGSYDASAPPGELAAVARILVTNDPSYVPSAAD